MILVKQLRNGQITIPKKFRDELGLQTDDLLAMNVNNGKLEIERVSISETRGSPWLRDLYELFAPLRESLAEYSEQEINNAIDEAIKEVRAEEE